MSLFGAYNHVCIVGNMTRDPEIRTTGNGKRVGNITVAINEGKDETTFVDVTAWEKTAELIERFGGKGKRILVDGRVKQEKWQDKATGENRSKLIVVANSVSFMDSKDDRPADAPREDRTPPRNRGRDTRPAGGYETDPDAIGREPPSFDPRQRRNTGEGYGKGDYEGGYDAGPGGDDY